MHSQPQQSVTTKQHDREIIIIIIIIIIIPKVDSRYTAVVHKGTSSDDKRQTSGQDLWLVLMT